MPIFPTRKWRKQKTCRPPGAAQLVTVGVGTSKAAGDEGAGLEARPGSVGPGAPSGTASPQLWAARAEAKSTAGRHPSLPSLAPALASGLGSTWIRAPQEGPDSH